MTNQRPYIEMVTQPNYEVRDYNKDDPAYIITSILLFFSFISFNVSILLVLYCAFKNNEDARVKTNIKIIKILLIIYGVIVCIFLILGIILGLIF